MSVIYRNDVGTELILDCGVDVSTATVRKVRVRNPFGGVKEFSAVANTSNTTSKCLDGKGGENGPQ
jgi:hypothetical protein